MVLRYCSFYDFILFIITATIMNMICISWKINVKKECLSTFQSYNLMNMWILLINNIFWQNWKRLTFNETFVVKKDTQFY